MRYAGLYVRAKRKSGERDRKLAELELCGRERRQRVVRFADAVVELANALAHASEVESYGGIAESREGPGQRLHDLVVECSSLKWVRMRDERDASQQTFGNVERDFERAGGTGNGAAALASGQILSLSTTRPCT